MKKAKIILIGVVLMIFGVPQVELAAREGKEVPEGNPWVRCKRAPGIINLKGIIGIHYEKIIGFSPDNPCGDSDPPDDEMKMTFFMRLKVANQYLPFGSQATVCFLDILSQQYVIERFIKAHVLPFLAEDSNFGGLAPLNNGDACFWIKKVPAGKAVDMNASAFNFDQPFFTLADFTLNIFDVPAADGCTENLEETAPVYVCPQ
jgi:hypothetical protein